MAKSVNYYLSRIAPEIRSMSKDEGVDFIYWLTKHRITLLKLTSYSFSKQLDLLSQFRSKKI